MKVFIVGAGEIGTAMHQILNHHSGNDILVFDKDARLAPDGVTIAEGCAQAEVVFLCVPSAAIRELATECKKYLPPTATVVCLAKGLEAGGKNMAVVLNEVFGEDIPFGVLAGPMLAEELMARKGGVGVFAGSQPLVHDKIVNLFVKTDLLIEVESDLLGTAWCGVFKNVYVILLGVADGLRWGANRRSWLLAVCVREMAEAVAALGGEGSTAFGTAGLGDLTATGFSPFSTNRDIGQHLVEGHKEFQSEGKRSLPELMKLLPPGNFPLLRTLDEMLEKDVDARERLEAICAELHKHAN